MFAIPSALNYMVPYFFRVATCLTTLVPALRCTFSDPLDRRIMLTNLRLQKISLVEPDYRMIQVGLIWRWAR
jgi:hypothetical protein